MTVHLALTTPLYVATEPDHALAALVDAAARAPDDASAAVEAVRSWGSSLPQPGGPSTAARFELLRTVARTDLTAARVLEAHADALAILSEADAGIVADGAWGVFAAEAPDARLTAAPGATGFRLDGVKPWCSVAGLLDRALVTAHVDGGRRLFAVDLRHPGVQPEPANVWAARGLRTVTSGPVRFTDVPAVAVGEPGWYLERPGFAWGGIGVAACWLGGVDALADTLLTASRGRSGEVSGLHVGSVDAARHAADCVLTDAAERIAAGRADGRAGRLLAARVRAVVADTVERVLGHVGHALGPAPLAFDHAHAARVADLTLYVRQHHAERDLAALGHDVVAGNQR